MLGDGEVNCLDTSSSFIVCFNYIGSPYGSCAPITFDERTGQPYGGNFPSPITMRDQAVAMRIALEHGLGVK